MISSDCTAAFSMDDLDLKRLEVGRCPVIGCTSDVNEQLVFFNKNRNLPFCPVHGLRIHKNTFVYYNGSSQRQKELAFRRNIVFNWDFFRNHFIQNTKKVGGHRLSWENSEDAVTYNVFSELARTQISLQKLLAIITGIKTHQQVEVYLWGHRIDLISDSAKIYPPLNKLTNKLELNFRIKTEPDIILRVPDVALVFIEAKFTSGNSLSKRAPAKEGEKPHSVKEMINRYVKQNPFLDETNPFDID